MYLHRAPLGDARRRARGATPAGASASGPKASSNRSTKTICPLRIFRRASAIPNQAARSMSGKVRRRPERDGHSISKVLLRMSAGSQSPSMAQALTTLPPGCNASPSGKKSPSGRYPISSANSRRAADSGASSAPIRPFGMLRYHHPCFAKMVLPDDREGLRDGRHVPEQEEPGALRFPRSHRGR